MTQVQKVIPVVTEQNQDNFIDPKYGFHIEALSTAPLKINQKFDLLALSAAGDPILSINPSNISLKALYFDVGGVGYRFGMEELDQKLTRHEITNFRTYICSYASNIPANELFSATGERLTEEDFKFFFEGGGSIHIERGDCGFFAKDILETFQGYPIIPIGFDLDLEFSAKVNKMTNEEETMKPSYKEILDIVGDKKFPGVMIEGIEPNSEVSLDNVIDAIREAEKLALGIGGIIAFSEVMARVKEQIPHTDKTLNNTNQAPTQQQVSDVEIVGNTDLFQILCKASSKSQGWMKSTKAKD